MNELFYSFLSHLPKSTQFFGVRQLAAALSWERRRPGSSFELQLSAISSQLSAKRGITLRADS